MKKISKICVKSMQTLTNEEMAKIEGGLVIVAEDSCNEETCNKPCVYSYSTTAQGCSTIVLGICEDTPIYVQNGPTITAIYKCKYS